MESDRPGIGGRRASGLIGLDHAFRSNGRSLCLGVLEPRWIERSSFGFRDFDPRNRKSGSYEGCVELQSGDRTPIDLRGVDYVGGRGDLLHRLQVRLGRVGAHAQVIAQRQLVAFEA